jgi:hypothetical protein
MRKPEDLTGRKFNRWTAIELGERTGKGRPPRWLCRCECGKEQLVFAAALKNGHSKSCGCWNMEKIQERNYKHGHSPSSGGFSSTYTTWSSMVSRCTNPNEPAYARYGGRGISVCPEWLDFANFLKDMGEKPRGRYSIDRIDFNRGYEKSNCRWATDKEQARNKSSNRLITFNGETKCVGEWSEVTGIHPMTIIYRLNKGASPEEALSQEKKSGPRIIEYRGRTMSVTEWGRLIGKKPGTISTQLSRGYPLERILGEI